MEWLIIGGVCLVMLIVGVLFGLLLATIGQIDGAEEYLRGKPATLGQESIARTYHAGVEARRRKGGGA